MKIAIQAFMLAAVVVFSACGNTEELEAQKAKVDDLTLQLSDVKNMFEQMKQEQDEEAKAQLDASGIAVVDLYKLTLEYDGYVNEVKRMQRRYDYLKAKMDKEELEFSKEVQNYYKSAEHLSPEVAQKEKQRLENKEQELISKRSKVSDDFAIEKDEAIDNVLGKVNDHLKDFAEKNGYQMILFTSIEGFPFYAKDYINITDTYIANLNEAYANGFK